MKTNELKERIGNLIEGKKSTEKPEVGTWVAKKLSDGQIGITVSNHFEGKDFVCVDQIAEYIDYLIQK